MHNDSLETEGSRDADTVMTPREENGTNSSPWASLTSKTQIATVEHAIADLRNGFPVVVQGIERGATLVMAAETARLETLTSAVETPDAGLVIPAVILRHAGIKTEDAQRFDISGWTVEELTQTVFSPVVNLANGGEDAPVEDVAAIHLLKLAQLLPTAVTVPVPSSIDVSHLVAVDVTTILRHHDNIAYQLSIVARTRTPLAECENTEFVLFHGSDGLKEQLAILIGAPSVGAPVPVRVHSACLSGDLFGSLKCDCGEQLRGAVDAIAKKGGGVLLYLDQEGRSIGLRNKMRANRLQELDYDTFDADAALGYGPDERRYGIAQRMLELLGYHRVLLLTNNPKKASALASDTICVVGTEPLHGSVNRHNARYLATKAKRAGHLLPDLD